MTTVKDNDILVSENKLQDQTQGIDHEEIASLPRRGTTPLPRLQMTVLCFALICEPIVSTIIFPFLYAMVRSFNIAENEKEVGRYSGWIASSFFIAQFSTIMIWGRVSDLIGRRPVLLIGLLGNSITSCLFGLSKSFWWAISMRALCGIMNSNVGVIRTMLGELTDMTNKSEAFSLYSVFWSTGLVIGPTLGGYFVYPAEQLPWLFGHCQFLIKYPFFLPCFISSTLSLTGFILGYFYLEETNPFVTGKIQNQVDERTHLLAKPQLKSFKDNLKAKFPRAAIFPILAQCLLYFQNIVYDEVFCLYATSPTSAEGLGFPPAKFAFIWTIVGFTSVLYRFALLPWSTRRYDAVKLLRFSHCSFMALHILVPSLTSIRSWLQSHILDSSLSNGLFMACYTIIINFRFLGSSFAYSSIHVIINLSATPETLGLVNGVAQACMSLSGMSAPPFGSNMWSWSIQGDKPYPFDRHFIFYICALICLAAFFETYWIPKKLAYIKKNC